MQASRELVSRKVLSLLVPQTPCLLTRLHEISPNIAVVVKFIHLSLDLAMVTKSILVKIKLAVVFNAVSANMYYEFVPPIFSCTHLI